MTGLPLLAIILYFLKNPEKAEKWAAILARLFAYFSDAAEKRTVAGEIQADIKSFANALSTRVNPAILPYGIKIRWEKTPEMSYESFVKDGQVVVRLRHHSNQARNFVLACLAYIQSGLLPEARPYFSASVSEALDLAMTRKALLDRKRSDAFSIFSKEIIGERNSESAVLRMYDIMGDLDGMGMFSQILLREFGDLGKRLSGITPTSDIKDEITCFVMFCEKLAEKEPGVDVSPTFAEKILRLSVVLITRFDTYLRRGIEPHKKWIEKCLAEEVDSIYVCARGRNIEVARYVDGALRTEARLRKISEWKGKVLGAKGVKVDGVIMAYKRVVS